jgi:hypothetical protein
MNTDGVTTLPCAFPSLVSRRGVLAGAVGGLAMVPATPGAITGVAARKRDKRKNRQKRKRQRSRNASSPLPSGPVIATAAACSAAGNTGLGTTSGNARLAQTFTATASGALVRAELGLIKVAGTVGDYIVRLSPVDGSGVPTNVVLGEAAVSNLGVPDGSSLIGFTFANPAPIVAGTRYALILTRPGSSQVQWDGDLDGGCPGEIFISSNQTAPFEEFVLDLDLRFTIFVRS